MLMAAFAAWLQLLCFSQTSVVSLTPHSKRGKEATLPGIAEGATLSPIFLEGKVLSH